MDGIGLRRCAGDGDWQRSRILVFVQEFGRREGYSPSYRDIAAELGLAVSTVSYHVSVLQSEGSLRREPEQPRTITEGEASSPAAAGDAAAVPLIGQIAAPVAVMVGLRGASASGGRNTAGVPASSGPCARARAAAGTQRPG